jgi:hypothetical protein
MPAGASCALVLFGSAAIRLVSLRGSRRLGASAWQLNLPNINADFAYDPLCLNAMTANRRTVIGAVCGIHDRATYCFSIWAAGMFVLGGVVGAPGGECASDASRGSDSAGITEAT